MISIVALNWNTSLHMEKLFNSVRKNTYDDYEFIIVDNGSEKNDTEKLKTIPATKTRYLPKNIGFAAGNNIGIDMVNPESDFIAFINSDIIVNEKWWDQKFHKIFSDSKIGVAGCAYHPLFFDINGNFHIKPLANEPVESMSVQGAFFAIPNVILDGIYLNDNHYFDEEFRYAHYEETDLCFRIIQMGYKCMWLPIDHIHNHLNSATKMNGYHLCDEITDETSFKQNSERNKQRLIKKHSEFLKGYKK